MPLLMPLDGMQRGNNVINVAPCSCGYRPRREDVHIVKMNEDAGEYEYTILHVICYNCGKEWVE